METIPSPTVINVDFTAKPADPTERPFPARVEPERPVPFRKRTSFLPSRFFTPKRLPPGVPPRREADEPTGDAVPSPFAVADAAGENGGETAARPVPPPFPEATPTTPVEPTLVLAGEAPGPLPVPALETPSEPVIPPTPVAAAVPEPAGSAPEPAADLPAAPAAPAPTPAPDAGSRADERGASVQLTFSCEVAALRFTPAFGLGAVHLRALSQVVALRFVAPGETGNPLAAGVAFQIVQVELDPDSRRLKCLLLKPLDEARESVTPTPRLQVAAVGLDRDGDGRHAPISVTAAAQTSTAVQLFGTFTLGSIHFTPAFGVATLRLDLVSDTVLVRVTPSTLPTARDLPPAFDLAEAELDAGGGLAGLRLMPGKL